ncbi:hypothetical protein [Allobaculum sp. JKK-2023]|uniref:hypothetical protein n=1 Tax=Allobaculum sp. JKK-2023 TaxID=3108943 RepID=UPI002B056D0B|nr:hypothetical protein [Allobaculum sp. JKK-2023]
MTSKKQQLSCRQIHDLIRKEGYEIGLTTITAKVKEKRNKHKECFIAQSYEYGQRFEYDFGEAELFIGGINLSFAGIYNALVAISLIFPYL